MQKVWVTVGILTLITVWALVGYFIFGTTLPVGKGFAEYWGTVGDSFNILTSLAAWITVVLLVVAVVTQREELKATREELKHSRDAIDDSRNALQKQLEASSLMAKTNITLQLLEEWGSYERVQYKNNKKSLYQYSFTPQQRFIDKLMILSQSSQVSEQIDLDLIVDVVANDIEDDLRKVFGLSSNCDLQDKEKVIASLEKRLEFLQRYKKT